MSRARDKGDPADRDQPRRRLQLFFYDINRNGVPDIVFFGGGGNGSGAEPLHQLCLFAGRRSGSGLCSGVQGFTSLGENGLAPFVWIEQPEITPSRPRPRSSATPPGTTARAA